MLHRLDDRVLSAVASKTPRPPARPSSRTVTGTVTVVLAAFTWLPVLGGVAVLLLHPASGTGDIGDALGISLVVLLLGMYAFAMGAGTAASLLVHRMRGRSFSVLGALLVVPAAALPAVLAIFMYYA